MNLRAIFSKQPKEIGALTGFRGIGSLWVLAAHLSLQLHPGGQATGPINYLIDSAELGVHAFFILSGFVIASNYQEFFQRWDRRQYFRFQVLRLGRIYPLHIFMLFATLAFVIVAALIGRQVSHVGGGYDLSAWSFVANLFLVQNWGTAVLSWNAPAWTLSAEWFAYLMFPLAAYTVFRRLGTRRARLAVLAAVYGVLTVCTTWISQSQPLLPLLQGISGFTAGVIVWMWVRDHAPTADHPPAADRRPVAALVGLVGVTTAVLVLRAIGMPVDMWPAPFLVLLMLGLTVDAGPVSRVFSSAPAIFLGRISYSLYLSHIWVIFGVRTFIAPRFDASLQQAVVIVLSPLIAIPVATVLFLAVEEPWRKRARAFVRRQRPSALHGSATADLPEARPIRPDS